MPRLPRLSHPGGVYHVFSRGNNRETIFHDEEDYRAYWQRLGTVVERSGWRLYAVALMPNHLHHVVAAGVEALSAGMQALLGWYAQRVNRRFKRVGHLFQGRFGYRLCDKDSYLMQLIRYVHRNPVEAGLVKSVEDWTWTSHPEYMGTRQTPWIDAAAGLALFGTGHDARRQYLAFLNDDEAARKFEAHLTPRLFLGDEQFIEVSKMRHHLRIRQDERPSITGVPLERLAGAIGTVMGVDPVALRQPGKSRRASRARRVFSYVAVRHGHHTVTAVAAYLGRSQPTVSLAIQGYEQMGEAAEETGRVLAEVAAGEQIQYPMPDPA